jgi:hypothetical protein
MAVTSTLYVIDVDVPDGVPATHCVLGDDPQESPMASTRKRLPEVIPLPITVNEQGLLTTQSNDCPGSAPLTAKLATAMTDPPVLLPVIVYTVRLEVTVGRPDNKPFVSLRTMPVGSPGSMLNVVSPPPVDTGCTCVIAMPRTYTAARE